MSADETPFVDSERILGALSAGGVGVWHWNVVSGEVQWSPNLESIHQLPPGAFKGDFTSFADDIHIADRERVMQAVQDAVRRGGVYRIQYRLPPKGDERDHWIEAVGDVVTEGPITYMRGICHDISEHKHLELALAERLRQQEAVAKLGQMANEMEELEILFERTVEVLAETLALEYTKILELVPEGDRLVLRAGVGWRAGLIGNASVGSDLQSQAGYTLISPMPVIVEDLAHEPRFSGPQLLLDHGVVSGMSAIIPGVDEQPFGVLGVHTAHRRIFSQDDINFLQSVAHILGGAIRNARANEMRELLYEELRHRVGNLFLVIQSLHRQTAQTSDSIEQVERKFAERLMALATSHEEITRAGWTTVPLRVLLQKLLIAYADRIDMAGDPVVLQADTAFPLAMVIHELTTNAGKYGCFSAERGRLTVRWSLETAEDGDRLVIEWTENGSGSTHTAAPGGSGFGSRLITATIEQQLQGELEREYADSGLRARFAIPVNRSAIKTSAA